jgi:hypothetical protein
MKRILLLIVFVLTTSEIISREDLVVEFVFDAQVTAQEITSILSWESLEMKNISIELTRLRGIERYRVENSYNHISAFESQNPCGFIWCLELREYLQNSGLHKAYIYNSSTKPLDKCGVLDRIAIITDETTLSKELKIAKKNKLERVIVIIHKNSVFMEVPEITFGAQFNKEFQEYTIFQGQKMSFEPKFLVNEGYGDGRYYWFENNLELTNSQDGRVNLAPDESSVYYCEWRSEDESCISKRSEIRINIANCEDEMPFKLRFRNSDLFQSELLDTPIGGFDEVWWVYPSPKAEYYYFIADSVCGASAFKLELRNLKGEEVYSKRYDMQKSTDYMMVYNDVLYNDLFEDELIFGFSFHKFMEASGGAFNEDLELRMYPIYRGNFEDSSSEKYLVRFNRCMYED